MPSFAGYKMTHLKSDMTAALVVTAIAVPESLGFAAIVGLPPVAGLYTALFAPIIFALFSQSKRLVVGADSATAALVASGAGLAAAAGSESYATAIMVLGVLTGLLLIIMAVAKFGFLADLISRPVIVGFLAGIGLQIMLMKLPQMAGLEFGGSYLAQLGELAKHIKDINMMTLTVSVLVIGSIILTRHSKIPGQLIGLVLATLLAVVFQLEKFDVPMVGALPSGLPQFTAALPSIPMAVTLLVPAVSIALVILAQSSAVIRSSSGEHDDKINIRQDLLALGFANIASAVTRGFAVNGSPPRTLAADLAGAHSQVVNIIMSVLIGLLLLFGGQLFEHMPVAALAAIVFMIGLHLVRWRELEYLWATHRTEFFVAMVALVGTVAFGVRQGIIIAVAVSLMERLSRQYRPRDEVLLCDGVFSAWAAERLGAHASAHQPEGMLVYSFDGSLFFENAQYFFTRVKHAINKANNPVKVLIIEAGAIESVDYTAVEVLKQLYRQLSVDGIRLGFAHVSPHLREQFDEYGVTDLVNSANIYSTLAAAIKEYPGEERSALRMVNKLKLKRESYVVIGGGVLELLHLRNTHDVDIVVNDEMYKYFRDQKHWPEFTLDYNKKILSRGGCNLMRTWVGSGIQRWQKKSFTVDGVQVVGLDDLIDAKRRLGRKKDLSDVTLLENYKIRHHITGSN